MEENNNQYNIDNNETINTTGTIMNEPIVQTKKSNNKIIIILIMVFLAIGLFLGGFAISKHFFGTKTDNKEKVEDKPKITKTKDVKKLTLSQASVNGITISFPSNKYEFEATGWVWNKEKAKTDLAAGYSMSGGYIGEYPGGVVVSVTNLSGKTQHLEDCTIDDGNFYNPGNEGENVYFVGGLNFKSTEEEVKTTMGNLGYKNVKTKTLDDANYYDYYLDDKQENYRDYVEFYFYKGKIKSVSIYTSAK